MNEQERLIKVYTGTMIDVDVRMEHLEENGIPTLVRDDFQSGLMAGVVTGVPSAIDLFVFERDADRALVLIAEFEENRWENHSAVPSAE
ncbi:Putative signal transducing protein [Catalinimonas alkaloidigena]|uniref:Putative signal transducing protein n=1 Tax=Catalinimonas alkaloidigena TaxID=1075417 RepID=A0A1G9BKB7_9BACT|nr:DUF2007 domain-containing protein [Catalinimonas alkaloidigena]SDK39922.1 Putative signal transducing protein [Catalinimonas alkaloidigena]